MESITSRSDLEAFVMKMDEHTVERSTQFMMTGYAYDDKKFHEQPCQHSRYGKRSRLAGGTLLLERTDARVEFVVKPRNPPIRTGRHLTSVRAAGGW